MTPSGEGHDKIGTHYQRTLENLELISEENLHFIGYFENQTDTLRTGLQNLNAFFAKKAGVTAGELVLDVGCGAGGPACYLAERVGCRVIGIDIGAPQLEKARRLAHEKRLAHLVTFCHQDATQLSFKAEQFDVALIMGSASNIRLKEKLFAECARVIKKNGRLILGEPILIDVDWFHQPRNSLQMNIMKAFFGNPLLETLAGYRHLLHAHGFQILEIQDFLPHMLRSFELWMVALEEVKPSLVKNVGNDRYRGLVKGINIIAQIARDGRVGGVVVSARKAGDAV